MTRGDIPTPLAADASLWENVVSVLSSRPVLGSLAVFGALALAHWFLIRRSKDMGAEKRFPRQLVMLALTGLAIVVLIIVCTKEGSDLRGHLFAAFGVIASAVLGLSSTTFISNAMAGVLLRLIRNFRSGDFIRVGEEFGRVTERGLFHTEIQTEDRDLVTLPNLLVATKPVRVVRKSGTIVSITLSLGYDVERALVESTLKEAAEEAGLQEPFVHIVELGDFAISYRLFGFLPEVRHLRAARSNLRKSALDCLHRAGVEIVSPTFMNRRDLDPDVPVIPDQAPDSAPGLADEGHAEALIFDKADQAEAREGLRIEREQLTAKLEELKKSRRASSDEEKAQIAGQIEETDRRLEDIATELDKHAEAAKRGEPE